MLRRRMAEPQSDPLTTRQWLRWSRTQRSASDHTDTSNRGAGEYGNHHSKDQLVTAKKARPTQDPKALQVQRQETETAADALAHAALRPTIQAALTVRDYNKAFGEVSINALVSDLRNQCELASNGDLGRTEAILVAQAHSLDAIFNKLARKAEHCEYLNQFESNLRLALKAQSQCRATLETLAAIKNPQPVAFVRQANIAHGPQQVNNNVAEDAHTREIENRQDKLFEVENGKRLESRTSGAAIGTNSSLETVGVLHRPENTSR